MKFAVTLALLCAPTLALAQGAEAQARQLLARFDAEPNINQVQQAALSYARMHPEIFEQMQSRSRVSAALPELKVRVLKELDDKSRSVVSFDDTNTADKVSATEEKEDDLYLWGEVKWKLGDMVFSPRETGIIKENRYVAKERAKLLQNVTQIYFERRRAQMELVQAPPADATSRAMIELKIAQLTGELDALTGGGFSRLVAGK